jgi:hypothetical protein
MIIKFIEHQQEKDIANIILPDKYICSFRSKDGQNVHEKYTTTRSRHSAQAAYISGTAYISAYNLGTSRFHPRSNC